jgi:hypothetical protein
LKRHPRAGAVEDAARGNLKVLNLVFGFEQFALGSQSSDAYQCHTLFSLFIRLLARGKRNKANW